MTEIGTDSGASREIVLLAPPERPRPVRGAALTRLLPVVMAAAMIAVTLVLYRSGAGAARGPVFALLPVLMLISAAVTALTAHHRDPAGGLDDDRDDYLGYLAGLRAEVTAAAAVQRDRALRAHPDPAALWTLIDRARESDCRADPAPVRVGLAPVPAALRLVAPARSGLRRADPVTEGALRDFLARHSEVPDVPVTVDAADSVLVTGDRESARALVRALLCRLAVCRPPAELLIAALVDPASRESWEWLKWLPHHWHPLAVDDAGPARLSFPAGAAAARQLTGLPQRIVVVAEHADGVSVTGPELGAEQLRLHVTPTSLTGYAAGAPAARPDLLGEVDALVCARRLAGSRSARPGARAAAVTGWPELLSSADITGVDPDALWRNTSAHERLRVPVGSDADGNPVLLDVKEAAEGGTGPHGLCIGATGSGKSEFLRTLVLGMMARHSPAVLNLVLVDFKGGATFLGFEQAEHVAAVITNLADEAALVERMGDALLGELNRRQELLRANGFSSVADYTRARAAGAGLAGLPALLVIVDEFSELLSQHPDFIDTFVALGRLGRSLGVHLLLASQRLDEGRLRGLDAHLSYRVCLKTASAAESRIVLGTPDAYELPNIPGLGYLRTASGTLTRFQTAFVSGACPQTDPPPRRPRPAAVPFTAAPCGPVLIPAPAAAERTVTEVMLGRLAGHGPAARRIWLPPLGESPALGDLLDQLPAGAAAGLTVPIGVVDRPYEQCRTPLVVDLAGSAGHVAVVGAPQSGKSTALVTLVRALAAVHDAGRVQVYGLDLGGGALAAVRSLPQVGTVAGRGQPELVRRTVEQLAAVIARRERETARDPHRPDVFLVIDGWAALCADFDGLEVTVTGLAQRGLSFGVHVVLSATRWAEIRPGLRDLIGTRIELRLGDPADSELDRRRAERVPRDRPGRGLTDTGLHMLIARSDERTPLRRSAAVAPPVPVLPPLVRRDALPAGPDDGCVLGVDECELATVTVDFRRQPHLLIFGGNECGKSSVLRLLGRDLIRTGAPPARLLLVDYRRSLLDVAECLPGQLAGYAMSPAALAGLLPGLLAVLAARMPGAGITAAQLRQRSWWSGPELYVLVDDYDLVATAAGNPLTPLLEYLPHAADIGLHLVLARRSAGAARAGYEPVLAAVRELGAMGLLMSADPDDGPLLGSVRPGPLPPGRATLITGAGERRIQVAWSP